MVLSTILHITVYAIVGLIPVLYNYYFIKDKVRKLRKFYLDKLRKHQEQIQKRLSIDQSEGNKQSMVITYSHSGKGCTSISTARSPTPNIITTGSLSQQGTSASRETHQGYIQPYTITLTSHITSPVTSVEQRKIDNMPSQYVVVIIMDKNMVMNVPVISNIISSIPQMLSQVSKDQIGFVGSNEGKS